MLLNMIILIAIYWIIKKYWKIYKMIKILKNIKNDKNYSVFNYYINLHIKCKYKIVFYNIKDENIFLLKIFIIYAKSYI